MADSSLWLLILLSISLMRSAAASLVCPRSDFVFLDGLESQCPLGIENSPPLEVSSEIMERELSHCQKGAYYSVLIYASWCPFSRDIRPIFDAVSSMYPQLRHLAVEESSALPSVFSRYGVHSFPAILIVNRTTRVRYHGSKDLSSLVHFYKKNTGLDPVSYFIVDQTSNSGSVGGLQPWDGSLKDIISNEPYLAFGLLFICLRIFVRLFPAMFYRLKDFWVSHAWQPNVGIFQESSHLLKQALQLVDIKRLWSKLRLGNKTGNFHRGAKNARVWASSLTSVALGESSSSRLAPVVS